MFKQTMNLFYLLLVFGFFLAGCSRTVLPRNESPTATPEAAAPGSGADAWIEALTAAGTPAARKGGVTQPFFSVPGQVVALDGGEVQLYIYADEVAAKSEAGLVSPDGTSAGTTMITWMAAPHFYRSANAIALYLGDDAGILTALEKVFGPQFAGG